MTHVGTALARRLKRLALARHYKRLVMEPVRITRAYGLMEVRRRRGWKVFLFIIFYYLIRDTLIYLLVPLLIARGLMG